MDLAMSGGPLNSTSDLTEKNNDELLNAGLFDQEEVKHSEDASLKHQTSSTTSSSSVVAASSASNVSSSESQQSSLNSRQHHGGQTTQSLSSSDLSQGQIFMPTDYSEGELPPHPNVSDKQKQNLRAMTPDSDTNDS